MGLDMYLNGEKHFFGHPPEEARIRHEEALAEAVAETTH